MPSVPNQSHMISPYIFNPSTFVTGATIPSHHVPPATSRMTQLTVRKEAHNARQPVRQLSLRGTHIEGWIQWHLQLLKVNMCSINIIQVNDFFTSTGCYSPKKEGLKECIWENILKQWAGSNQPTVPSPFSIERFFFPSIIRFQVKRRTSRADVCAWWFISNFKWWNIKKKTRILAFLSTCSDFIALALL